VILGGICLMQLKNRVLGLDLSLIGIFEVINNKFLKF